MTEHNKKINWRDSLQKKISINHCSISSVSGQISNSRRNNGCPLHSHEGSPLSFFFFTSGFICPRKTKPAESICIIMPKTVVMLRRILTVIIPFIYIFFVTGTVILFWYIQTSYVKSSIVEERIHLFFFDHLIVEEWFHSIFFVPLIG